MKFAFAFALFFLSLPAYAITQDDLCKLIEFRNKEWYPLQKIASVEPNVVRREEYERQLQDKQREIEAMFRRHFDARGQAALTDFHVIYSVMQGSSQRGIAVAFVSSPCPNQEDMLMFDVSFAPKEHKIYSYQSDYDKFTSVIGKLNLNDHVLVSGTLFDRQEDGTPALNNLFDLKYDHGFMHMAIIVTEMKRIDARAPTEKK
jgi:hypothetical protein